MRGMRAKYTLICILVLLARMLGQGEEGLLLGSDRPFWDAARTINGSDLGSLTLEAWVKVTDAQGNRRIAGLLIGGKTTVSIGLNDKQDLTFECPQGRYGVPANPGSGWVHVAGVSDAGQKTVRLYLNGKMLFEKTGANGAGINGNDAIFRLGAASKGDNRFKGRVARVGLWKTALDAGTIAKLAASREPPELPNAAMTWLLAENPGDRMEGSGEWAQALVPVAAPVGAAAVKPAGNAIRVAVVGDGIAADPRFVQALQNLLGSGHEAKGFGLTGAGVLASGEKPWAKQSAAGNARAFKPQIVVMHFGPTDTGAGQREKLGAWGKDLQDLVLAFLQAKEIRTVLLCTPVITAEDIAAGAEAAVAAEKLEVAVRLVSVETGMGVCDTAHAAKETGEGLDAAQAAAAAVAESLLGRKPDLKAVNAAPPATAAAPQAGSSNRIRVALIGDGVADKCGHFQMVAKELAGTHDVKRFIGDHSSLAAASDRYLLKQDVVAKASAHKPALVVLMAGTYDASSNRDAATTQLDKDVAEILAKLEAGESRPKLILCTPPPIRPDARDNLKEDRMADNVAPAIRFVAAAKGIPLLDYHAMLVGRSDLFAPDNGQNSPVGVAEEMAAALREALEGKVLPPPARPRVRVACIGDTLDTARSLEKFLPKALGYGYEVALFQDPATRLLQKDKTPYSRTGKLAEARENKPGLVILTIAEDLTTATTFQEVSAFDRELRMVMNDVLSWKPKPVLLLCRPAPFDGITSAPKPDPKKDDKRKGGAPAKAGTGPEVFVDRAITTFRLAKADPGRILKDEALVPKDGKGVKDYGKGYAREIAAAVKGLEGSRGKVE